MTWLRRVRRAVMVRAALIGEYRDREAAKDVVIAALQERAAAQNAKLEALDLLVADLILYLRTVSIHYTVYLIASLS